MSFETGSPAAHLRAARAHLREASVAVEDQESRLEPSLARLIAELDELVDPVADAGVEAPPPDDVETILDVLDDEGCRRILAVTGTDALTVSEIKDACDIPRSTVYRKIDCLSETPLLKEDVRIGSRGPHAQEYRRTVDDVLVSLGPTPTVTLGTDSLSPGPDAAPQPRVPFALETTTGRYGSRALAHGGVTGLSDGTVLSAPAGDSVTGDSIRYSQPTGSGESGPDSTDDPDPAGSDTPAGQRSSPLGGVDIPAAPLQTVLSTDGAGSDSGNGQQSLDTPDQSE